MKEFIMKTKIYYLGDSIVAWNPTQKYCKYGIPGHTSLDMYWSLIKNQEIAGDCLIFSLGVNDIIYRYPESKSFGSYHDLFKILQERFSQIIILSLLPTDSIAENEEIRKYNIFLKKQGFFFCDVFDFFLDAKKERIAPQYTTDGTHLSHMGYALLNEHLDFFMQPFLSFYNSSN